MGGAAAVFLVWGWLFSNQVRQMQWIFTYASVLLCGLGTLFWIHRLSGLGKRARWIPTAALGVIIALFATFVRGRGLTGDWIPVLEWRFAETREWAATDTVRSALGSQPIDISPPEAFPRFLGADFNSVIRGLHLERDWKGNPPRLVWRRDVGLGWSGFAVAGGMAFTMEQRGDREVTVAYDLATGEELWSHGEVAYFSNPMAGPGPRATPTLSPTRVFTFGSTGILSAFDIHSGELVWQRDVVTETDAWLPEHGKSGAPLLVEDRVVVNAGGSQQRSLVAYSQETGEVVWQAGSDRAAYGAPVVARLAGIPQILSFNHGSVAGHAIDNGRILWEHPWPSTFPNVAPPAVVGDDRVMFSTGYGVGSKMIEVRNDGNGSLSAGLVWESRRMKAKFSNLVVHEGSIYGLDDGILVCLDPDTGERRWKRGRYGHGNILLVGDLLLVQTEKGEMVMIEPSPDEHREIGRFMALRGKAWNPFAIAGRYLLVRNDREAALWELPLRQS